LSLCSLQVPKQTDGNLGSCLRRSARHLRDLAACAPSNPDVFSFREGFSHSGSAAEFSGKHEVLFSALHCVHVGDHLPGYGKRRPILVPSLWQVSRINLNLIATHPDRCAGLGFWARVRTPSGQCCSRRIRCLPASWRIACFTGGELTVFQATGRWLCSFLCSHINIGGMCKYCVTDIVQKDLRCRLTALNCGENGHPQMFERCVHLTMGAN
jgi:hypothetical protein